MFMPKFIYNLLPLIYILCGVFAVIIMDHPIVFLSGAMFCGAGVIIFRWRFW